MCTALTLTAKNGDVVMGRTMDFSYPLEPVLYRLPKGYIIKGVFNNQLFKTNYSFIGMGQKLPKPTFADGVNEKGLAAAALYFSGYAEYDSLGSDSDFSLISSDKKRGAPCVAQTDVVSFILGMCENVSHALSVLKRISIIGVSDSITGSVSPLHWLICDKSGKSVTAEKTKNGFNFYDNTAGVLANSPDFPWHMTNLRNYINVSSNPIQSVMWQKNLELAPFGQAGRTSGLPGDYTSPSRFVKTAWLKSHAEIPEDGEGAIRLGFHILGNVCIPKGAVITDRGSTDYTQYTVFFNLNAFDCYLKAYDDMSDKISPNKPDNQGNAD